MCAVELIHLCIEGKEIVKISEEKKASCEQPQNPGDPFPHIETVDSKHSQKSEKQPGDGIIQWPRRKLQVSFPIHRGNEKKVDQPSNQEQTKRKEPDDAGNAFPVIKPMRPREAQNQKQIAEQLAM